jgi:hypothetical protein
MLPAYNFIFNDRKLLIIVKRSSVYRYAIIYYCLFNLKQKKKKKTKKNLKKIKYLFHCLVNVLVY